jgi:hypothetical protein
LLSPAGTKLALPDTNCAAECMKTGPLSPRSKSLENLISAVNRYLDRREDTYLEEVFNKYAKLCSGTADETIMEHTCADTEAISNPKFKAVVRTTELQDALSELGRLPEERGNVEEMITVMDLDGNDGLDFEEFKRAVQQMPTQLEQWASTLPLAGMLASSLPVRDGQGDKPLRDFNRLSEDEINTAADAFREGLKRLLMTAQHASRQMLDKADKMAIEVAKESADGVSAVSKFKTYKMSTGNVSDYHAGLFSRIGTALLHLCLAHTVSAKSPNAASQERRTSISPTASGRSTA